MASPRKLKTRDLIGTGEVMWRRIIQRSCTDRSATGRRRFCAARVALPIIGGAAHGPRRETCHDNISRTGQPSVVAGQSTTVRQWRDARCSRATACARGFFAWHPAVRYPTIITQAGSRLQSYRAECALSKTEKPGADSPSRGCLFRQPWRGTCRDGGSRDDCARDARRGWRPASVGSPGLIHNRDRCRDKSSDGFRGD